MQLNNDYLQTKHPWISLATRHLGIQRENSHMNTNTYTHTLQEMTQASTHCSIRSLYSSHWAVSALPRCTSLSSIMSPPPLCPSTLVLQPERASTVCLCMSLKAHLLPTATHSPHCPKLSKLKLEGISHQNPLWSCWDINLHYTHTCTNTLTKNTTPG